MKKVKIRRLLELPEEQIREGLKRDIVLLYEDNVEVPTTANVAITIRYVFNIFNCMPELPIISKYHLTNFFSSGSYVSKTFNKLFETILEDFVNTVIRPTNSRKRLEDVYYNMYQVINYIYNELVNEKLEYSTSISINDFLDIQMDDSLITAIKQVDKDKTLTAVENSYSVLDKVIRKPKYKDNIVAKSYITGTINPGQVKQMLASRGYVTEIDSSIFKIPICSSFTLGLNNIYELAVESRSGAKALFLSNRAIQEAEYFAREMQLVTMSVEKLVDEDCGSTEYTNWFVRDDSHTGKSDIGNLVGKYFLNEETNKLEVITKNHTHLHNTTIKLRTASNCKHPNKRAICTTCFGDLSYNVFEHTNIGHISSTTLTQKITQSILSTKHLNNNATSSNISLDDTTKKYFSIKAKNGYALRSAVLNKSRSKMYFIIDQDSGFGLKDINNDTNVYNLNLSRVSRIDSIIIRIEHDGGKVENIPIIVKQANRYGSFTHTFLKHVIKKGYKLNDNNDYVIDMSEFDSTDPIMVLPQVEFNFLALALAIKKEFKSMDVVKNKYSAESKDSLLQKVFDLVNDKLDVNIALLEVIVYAFTIVGYEERDYNLGRNAPAPQLAKISTILGNRSLSGSLSHEKVDNIIYRSGTSNGRNNIDHILDVMYDPVGTLNAYYGTN